MGMQEARLLTLPRCLPSHLGQPLAALLELLPVLNDGYYRQDLCGNCALRSILSLHLLHSGDRRSHRGRQ